MATPITWSDVTARDPFLASGVATATQNAILEQVELEVSETKFGKFYKVGRVFLAAHYGVLSKRAATGAAGPVGSESIGGISRSYLAFSPNGSDALLDTTQWGKEYRRIRRLTGAGGLVT